MKFLKEIQKRVFPTIIALSALSVSASAAFYSVTGLSKLFAGAQLQVLIMAGSLEIAKLVIASLLYQYWSQLNRLLKIYLTVAATVLVLITSAGIYGFLSSAYQETANLAGNVDAQVALVETKRDNVKEQLLVYNGEKSTINEAISDLRKGLSNNVIQYRDKETGQIITTTSSSTRRALERQLDQAIERQSEINKKVDELNEELFEYETQIIEIQTNNDLAGELGPLKYISELTGTPMNMVVNILMLVIIFVFDPLAISLVIAANFAFDKIKKPTDNIIHQPAEISDEDLEKLSTIIESKEVLDKQGVLEKYSDIETQASKMSSVREDLHDLEEMDQDTIDWADLENDSEEELMRDFDFDNADWEGLSQEEWNDIVEYQETKTADREKFVDEEEIEASQDEEEFDEDHALDQVMNDMVDGLDEEFDKVEEGYNDVVDEKTAKKNFDVYFDGDKLTIEEHTNESTTTEETTIFEEKDEDLGVDTVYDEDNKPATDAKLNSRSPYLRVGNRVIPRNVRYRRG